MKTQLRLNSVVPHGIGSSSESIFIDILYSYLLMEYGQNKYSYIGINQIGSDLEEFVIREPGNKIHCNIRYTVYNDFELKSNFDQNNIRLDAVHTALVRIAEYDKLLEIDKLEAIKKRISDASFSFDFVCKAWIHKKDITLVANVIVHPDTARFDYYIVIEEGGKQKCKGLIYSGKPVSIYTFADFWGIGKWSGTNEFILTGKRKEVETRITIEGCKVKITNLTNYDNPPFYTLMKSGISKEEEEKARKDWEHSLPPAIAAMIRRADN